MKFGALAGDIWVERSGEKKTRPCLAKGYDWSFHIRGCWKSFFNIIILL